MLRNISAIPTRIINHYIGPADKNTIEYWQRFIFYVISLSGAVAGTLAIVPSATVVFLGGDYLGGTILVAAYAINVAVVFAPRLSIKAKTLIIAFFFSLIGAASLAIAGPEGESGIWFSVSTLICSLFIGPKIAVFAALLNLMTGLTFGVLHSMGLIGWDVLHGFRFHSWLIQSFNIFVMDIIFVIANTFLIRGVDNTFHSLSAAEGKVRSALDEKEALIRELYHRAKNNMQVISSLLSLHSTELRDESAKAVFKNVIDKIVAMALVHQKLYESHDLSNIDMAAYVRDLVDLMMKSYGVSPDKVQVNLRLEGISMLLDTAVPCGLIISEIIANSLKYAFPGDRKGTISIAMTRTELDSVELRIDDDGVGLAEGFDAAVNARMGMKTLFSIVRHQLQGSIDLSSISGVAYLIRFKRMLYEERVKSDS